MREVVIVAAKRTPIGRGKKGTLAKTRPDDMLAVALKGVIKQVKDQNPDFNLSEIEDVLIGCAFPEAEQGMNVARIGALLAGIPQDVPAATINRFCGSAMTCLHAATHAIMSGVGDIYVVGGTESMTKVPMIGNKFSPNPKFVEGDYPQVYVPMGETAERVVDRYGDKYDLSREALDKFAYNSHMKAIKAQDEGKFDDEIIKVIVNKTTGEIEEYTGEVPEGWVLMDKDECPRRETSMEALAKLRPVFRANGRVTAGNSSPINDGSSAMILMSREKAEELGLKILGKVTATAVRALEPEVMGLGPIYSTNRLLERAGLKVDDIDLFEINEAFATQSIVSIKELGIDEEKVNVNGGAIAIGHPLGISGTRIITTLLYEMIKRDAKRGVATMCIGGGQGIATLIERD